MAQQDASLIGRQIHIIAVEVAQPRPLQLGEGNSPKRSREVLPPAFRQHNRIPFGIACTYSRFGSDAAYARRTAAAERQIGEQRCRFGIRRGEAQFVVVAAAKLESVARWRVAKSQKCRRNRQRLEVDLRADSARGADVTEVGNKSVGNVDAGACPPAQRKALRDARCRAVEPLDQSCAAG